MERRLGLKCIFGVVFVMVVCCVGPWECRADKEVWMNTFLSTVQSNLAGGGVKFELLHQDHVMSGRRSLHSHNSRQRLRRDAINSQTRARSLVRRARSLEQLQNNVGTTENYRALRDVSGSKDNYLTPILPSGGDYAMNINLGTPGRKFAVIADTGSDLIWIQCKPCSGSCFEQDDPVFDPLMSSTYRTLDCSSSFCEMLGDYKDSCSDQHCKYSYGYGGNSSTIGDLAIDVVTLKMTHATSFVTPDLAFGCGYDNEGTFQSSIDGIVGLGRGPLSFNSQLGALFGQKFSYCLVDRYQAVTDPSPIIFGESSANGILNITYTPLVKQMTDVEPTFYYVGMTGITVGGELLPIPSSSFSDASKHISGTFFDSGTTFTQLDPAAYRILLQAIESYMTDYQKVTISDLDLCYNITGLLSTNFSIVNITAPAVSFLFDGAIMDLTYENTFIEYETSSETGETNETVSCLAMQALDPGLNIIGNWQQMNFHVIYDLQNSQVGWAPTTCGSNADYSQDVQNRSASCTSVSAFWSIVSGALVVLRLWLQS